MISHLDIAKRAGGNDPRQKDKAGWGFRRLMTGSFCVIVIDGVNYCKVDVADLTPFRSWHMSSKVSKVTVDVVDLTPCCPGRSK
jgi:hypothetical protein